MSGSKVERKMATHIEVMDKIASELTYHPESSQRRAKSAFWARFSEAPLCEPEDISLAIALKFSGDNRVSRWWAQDGFKEWFKNRDEFRQRMEYLAQLALDCLEGILVDDGAQTSARVNAAKLIMEVARKTPSKATQEKFLDAQIASMDKKEVDAYIQKRIGLAPPSTLTDYTNPGSAASGSQEVPPTDEDSELEA